MKGLTYGVQPEPWTPPDDGNHLLVGLSKTPMRLEEREEPHPSRDGWVMAKTRLTGICGSDAKQVFMDFGENFSDSALNGYFTAPTVLGPRSGRRSGRAGPPRLAAGGRPAGRAEPVALVWAPRDRSPLWLVPGRRLQSVLALHRGTPGRRHPHRDLEGRPGGFRRVSSGSRVDVVRRSRLHQR